jgi:hypothetical protein
MATATAFERQTKVPYVLRKSETVDNVLRPQRRWHAVEIFQTVPVQEEKPEALSDFFDFHSVVSPTIVTARLQKIPRPSLIALSYEPHARKEVLELLATRISELRQTLGQPGVATAVARLRTDLKKAYEAASLRDDMANLASFVSILQDYCYMHWSKMSAEELTRIENSLVGMRKKSEISPKDVTRFAAALRGQGRSLHYPSTDQLYLDDEESAGEDSED